MVRPVAGQWRDCVAVVVAAESQAGRLASAIDQLTGHLPPSDQPWACPLCSTQSWPCSGFDDAARRLHAAGLRLVELVPLDLHPQLWPPSSPQPPQPPPRPDPPQHGWFDTNEEQSDA